jgi:PPOX class probable F420-dependent enzyme
VPNAPLPSKIGRFLAAPRAAVVATITADGAPVTTATWYEWAEERLLLSMDSAGHRVRNLRRDPRLALTVFGDDMYTQVSLLARVVELRDDPEFLDLDRLSVSYEGKPYDDRSFVPVSAIAQLDRWHTYGDPGASP